MKKGEIAFRSLVLIIAAIALLIIMLAIVFVLRKGLYG